jgi:hypothetical protein
MSAAGGEIARSAEYAVVPARSIDDARLVKFAAAAWRNRPPYDRILASWWRNAAPECAVAAIHQPSQAMVGLCGGRPCEWVIGGEVHPAVSICDWYVDPRHEGRLIGRRILRHFQLPGRFVNAISISDLATAYVGRMGWTGPYPSWLMAMPFPRLRGIGHRGVRAGSGLELVERAVAGGDALGMLGADLDRIEAARMRGALSHMRRGAGDWSWRLSIYPDRIYRFCVARRNGEPVGYVVVRHMKPGSSRQLGKLQGAMITDLVVVNDEPEVLRALGVQAASMAAEMSAAVALFVTTSRAHRRALTAIGFLSPGFPLLGRLLARRSPVVMWWPRGPGASLVPDGIEMTFADSAVDLDL